MFNTGSIAESEPHLRQGFLWRPHDAFYMVPLAQCLLAQGKTSETLQIIHQGLEKSPDNPELLKWKTRAESGGR